MSWMGALAGGAIGGLLGGPWGAAAGALIGHYVSRQAEAPERADGLDAEEKQAFFIIALFSCLAKLAKADGAVSREEADYVGRFINTHFAPAERETVRQIFNSARHDAVPYHEYIDRVAKSPVDRAFLQQFLGILCELAIADGVLSVEEKEFLNYAESKFGFPGYSEMFFGNRERTGAGNAASASDTLAACYAVLGCSAETTDQEIRSAWRRKCADFHPDKIQSKGLPPEFMEFAKNEMQRINQAYDEIRKARGFK